VYAQQQYPQIPCEWICSDYAVASFGKKQPDIIFSSLFCHHFTNDQLVSMLKWLKVNSKKGFLLMICNGIGWPITLSNGLQNFSAGPIL
jgi:hypothetical protein